VARPWRDGGGGCFHYPRSFVNFSEVVEALKLILVEQ
jgi:hypothetical protein